MEIGLSEIFALSGMEISYVVMWYMGEFGHTSEIKYTKKYERDLRGIYILDSTAEW